MFAEKKKLGKSDFSGPDKKDFLLLYSHMDSTPFDWKYLNRNSTKCLIQMCYSLGIPISKKSPLKYELIESIQHHLHPTKGITSKPIISATGALSGANLEKQREKQEKERLKKETSKYLRPFSGRARLNLPQHSLGDDPSDRKKYEANTESSAVDEDTQTLFAPFDKIPSTAIVIQRGGTTMYAEENDDENREPYDADSFEGQAIDKVIKLITPKKGSKHSLQSIYSVVYLWANIFFAVYVIFYILFWK